MAVKIECLAEAHHVEDAWELLQEYFEAINVAVRDSIEHVKNASMWIAYADGKPAGCVLLRTITESSGEVKRLYVRPAFRRLGIAGMLLRQLESHARKIGIVKLYLDSKDDLVDAIRFYRLSGYTDCERYNDNPQATIFMQKDLKREISVREFQPGDEDAFWTLNEAWISKLFKLEEKDIQILRNPQKYILQPGGQIYFVCQGEAKLGCCALIPIKHGYEVAKMGVAESERGKGIGRILLEHVIADARTRKLPRLYIETNKKLHNAIHLYESVGFVHIEPDSPSPYQRADVFMELVLS